MQLRILAVLRPAETEPTPLSLLRRLLGRLGLARCSAPSARGGCWRLPGIVYIVPSNIKKNRLHRYQGHLGRELDDVGQIDAACRVLVQALDERFLDNVRRVLLLLLGQVVDVDDGTMALELAGEQVAQELEVRFCHIDVERAAAGGWRRLGQRRGGLFTEIAGMLNEA